MSERAEKNIMIVDAGGRGSVLAERYAKSEQVGRIFAIPGNDLMYINTYGKHVQLFPRLKTTDVADIVAACKRYNIDLVDVAQDNAVEAGLVNALNHAGIPAVGPTREAGKVEWDKSWARELGKRAGIPQPSYETFTSFDEGIEYIQKNENKPYFIKASGLDGGKGALGALNKEEAIENINKLKTHGKASNTFLIEEWLMGDEDSSYEQGEEFSCFIISDGNGYKVIGYAQDHKRARTFDEGDNTGGMGCINKPLVITPQIKKIVEKTILKPFFGQMQSDNLSYTGILYLGGMLVKRDGDLVPYVIEWNSRWGDPEAQIIAPSVQNDFYDMGMTVVEKGIKEYPLEVDDKHRLVITGAARGYPYDYSAALGKQILGIREAQKTQGVKVYAAGIKEKNKKHYVDGGRIVYVTGEDDNLQEAIRQAYKAMTQINVAGNNLHYRTDIGYRDRERQSLLAQKNCQRTYESSGVKYGPVDHLKRIAQEAAKSTADILNVFGFSEVEKSRGESAYVVDMGNFYTAFVPEGLGTKNLVSEKMKDFESKESHYYASAWDTVAMIVNDLITVGSAPVVICPHWASGNSQWFENEKNVKGLVSGWAAACRTSGGAYGSGETAILKDVVFPNAIVLSGFGFGIIDPKKRFTTGEKLKQGDHIILIESSGIHANGISLARDIAQETMPYGYYTKLPSGKTFGEALLTKTHIYAKLQRYLFEADVDIHYMVNITGHGWRKLMRDSGDLTYLIHTVPQPQEEFIAIQEHGQITNEEMYSTFNMGAGFAFYVPNKDVGKVITLASSLGYKSWDAGIVEKGPRQVVIEPKNIIYTEETLQIR